MRRRVILLVSILADVIIFNTNTITEDGTTRPHRSSPFSYRERCLLDPVINPVNTLLVASQTRLDGSRTDLCRRPCRVISCVKIVGAPQTPSRDTYHDVTLAVMDRREGQRPRTRCCICFSETGAVCFETPYCSKEPCQFYYIENENKTILS